MSKSVRLKYEPAVEQLHIYVQIPLAMMLV
jgi:hypothetical protein